jgi:hypothetical protein
VRLPNAENAIVETKKLTDYCLNLNHPRGRHQARVFKAKLGITADNADFLRDIILENVLTAAAEELEKDRFGLRFVVEFPVGTILGDPRLMTAWIILDGESNLRLDHHSPRSLRTPRW